METGVKFLFLTLSCLGLAGRALAEAVGAADAMGFCRSEMKG